MPLDIVTRYARKAYTNFATHIYDSPSRMLALLGLLVLIVLPYGGFTLNNVDTVFVYASLMAILAASWDLLVGRTGQISLGHAIFYGFGSYSVAFLYKYVGWPYWITIPLSMLAGAGIALIAGIPSLRLKGPYLAMVTMALPLVAQGVLVQYRDILGGDAGIKGIPMIFSLKDFGGDNGNYYRAYYYAAFAFMVVSVIIIYKLATSKTGIVFISILDDELSSKACGINVTKYKLMSFVVSGLFGALSGSLAVYLRFGSAMFTDFEFVNFSFTPILVTIIGGIGTIYGPIVGVYLYSVLANYIFGKVLNIEKMFPYNIGGYAKALIFAIVVLFFVVKWPRGIARAIVDKLEDLQEPREIEEIEKKKAKKAKKG
jgi:branched-chain amino acid transport system permease protein